MKIVVLNECFLSNDNLGYLKSVGDLTIFSDTTNQNIAISRMAGADIVLADMFECPLNETVLLKAAVLKLLCINSTGFALVNLDSARSKNISVANTPGYGTEAVAEHTFALLLASNRHIIESVMAMKDHPFQIDPGDKAHTKYLGFTLSGKTIGIIGMGAIGSHVAKIAKGFGMTVICYSRNKSEATDVEPVPLNELFARADIISLHTPLNDQSRDMINSASISEMKHGVVIVNTSMGGCIVSDDLAKALEAGRVAAAGLDVIDLWNADNPLLHSPNTVITPHSAWFTREALSKIGDIMTDNVKAFLGGRSNNIVSL